MHEASTITIRQATEADLYPLLSLVHDAMTVYARQSGITQPLESLCEDKADMLYHIQTDYVLVAERNGQMAGTVRLVRHGVSTAYFSRFAVLPHLRQTGVGRKLYEAAEAWLQSNGYVYVVLHTALTNEPLVSFYQARGFHLIHCAYDRGYPRGTFAKDIRPYQHQSAAGLDSRTSQHWTDSAGADDTETSQRRKDSGADNTGTSQRRTKI